MRKSAKFKRKMPLKSCRENSPNRETKSEMEKGKQFKPHTPCGLEYRINLNNVGFIKISMVHMQRLVLKATG